MHPLPNFENQRRGLPRTLDLFDRHASSGPLAKKR
jgi:hypothetical protein